LTRVNMVYTVSEEEYEEELARLLKTTEDYIEDIPSAVKNAGSLLEAGNHEGCLKAIAQVRDSLAAADYRLHDVMNMIVSFLQSKVESDLPTPASDQATTDNAVDATGIGNLQARAQQIKSNIESLGLEVSEEQLQEIARGPDGKVG
jgi:hypothetical protein